MTINLVPSMSTFIVPCMEKIRLNPLSGLSREILNSNAFGVSRNRLCSPPASVPAKAQAPLKGRTSPTIVITPALIHSGTTSDRIGYRARPLSTFSVISTTLLVSSLATIKRVVKAANNTKTTWMSGDFAKFPSAKASSSRLPVGSSLLLLSSDMIGSRKQPQHQLRRSAQVVKHDLCRQPNCHAKQGQSCHNSHYKTLRIRLNTGRSPRQNRECKIYDKINRNQRGRHLNCDQENFTCARYEQLSHIAVKLHHPHRSQLEAPDKGGKHRMMTSRKQKKQGTKLGECNSDC